MCSVKNGKTGLERQEESRPLNIMFMRFPRKSAGAHNFNACCWSSCRAALLAVCCCCWWCSARGLGLGQGRLRLALESGWSFPACTWELGISLHSGSRSKFLIESFELEETLKSHLVQCPCNEQGHLQLNQGAQSLVQPEVLLANSILWHRQFKCWYCLELLQRGTFWHAYIKQNVSRECW